MKTCAQSHDFEAFVLEQLADLPDLFCKHMFGGSGLYAGEHFFAILHGGKLYFKTDTHSIARYDAQHLPAFQPNAKQKLKHYRLVPVEVLEDAETLQLWAEEAIRVAQG